MWTTFWEMKGSREWKAYVQKDRDEGVGEDKEPKIQPSESRGKGTVSRMAADVHQGSKAAGKPRGQN